MRTRFAYELVAKFYFDTGDAESALAHFKLAHKAYFEWGANAKADKLFLLIEEKFTNSWGNETPHDIQSIGGKFEYRDVTRGNKREPGL